MNRLYQLKNAHCDGLDKTYLYIVRQDMYKISYIKSFTLFFAHLSLLKPFSFGTVFILLLVATFDKNSNICTGFNNDKLMTAAVVVVPRFSWRKHLNFLNNCIHILYKLHDHTIMREKPDCEIQCNYLWFTDILYVYERANTISTRISQNYFVSINDCHLL